MKKGTKTGKKPWEMTSAEIGDMLCNAMSKSAHAYDNPVKRFKPEEGVEEVVDDSAFDDLPTNTDKSST